MDFGQWGDGVLQLLGQMGLDPAASGMGETPLVAVATAALLLVSALLGSGAAALTQGLTGGAPKAKTETPAADQPTAAKAAPEKPRLSDADAIKGGLAKTRKGFLGKLNGLLGKSSGLDAETIEGLEMLLVQADIGIRTTQTIIERVKSELSADQKKDPAAIRTQLEKIVADILGDKPEAWSFSENPKVVMVVGVNGVGKTTTIGKLAARYAGEGKKVVLAAGDTFRAAAVEQLEVWGERAGVPVVKGPEGGDPSSVLFDAIQKAKKDGADLVLCDTAGRLQTKTNLMKELEKVHRVSGKAMEGAPHEVLMVLDATTGQNALSQVKKFSEAVKVDALALTKLDGSAKGGIVVAIAHDAGLPVRFTGVGEGQHDLRDFDPASFVEGLFHEPDAAS